MGKTNKKEAVTFTPRKYQQEAIRHLLTKPHGGLFMDPGTGKTGCVLAAFHTLKKRGLVDKLIVFAPLRVAYSVWPAEVEKWGFPHTIHVLHKKGLTKVPEADIYVINYDGTEWLATRGLPLLGKHSWMAVFDESTYVKRTNTRRFKALKTLLPKFSRRNILTGTPIPNGFIDLFGQVYVADLGEALGKYVTQYRREFFYPTGFGGYSWALQQDGEQRILDKLDGYFYRVKAEDVLDLPPKHDLEVWVDLPKKARAAYEELEREFILDLKAGKVTAVNSAVLSGKLRQFTGGSIYDNAKKPLEFHEAKLEAVDELVEKLQGNPLLVAYEFTLHGEQLAARYEAPIVNGDTDPKVAHQLFGQFNGGGLPVLVAQAATLAHGINLQEACHHVAWFGEPWHLEHYIQFTRRVYRSGQKRTTFVHHFLVRDSIDELVDRVVRRVKNPKQEHLLKALQERYL